MNNNTGELVNNILLKLSAQNILKQEDLVNAKMIITLCIENYPKESEYKGAPLEIVAEKLGHSKLDTTRQCYASISRVTVHNAHNRYIG